MSSGKHVALCGNQTEHLCPLNYFINTFIMSNLISRHTTTLAHQTNLLRKLNEISCTKESCESLVSGNSVTTRMENIFLLYRSFFLMMLLITKRREESILFVILFCIVWNHEIEKEWSENIEGPNPCRY